MTNRRLITPVLVLAVGIAGTWAAARAGGTGAAIPAALATGFALALALRATAASEQSLSISETFDGAVLLLPGALTVYFAFNSGGYFPGGPAAGAIVVLLVLVLRVTLVENPFAGFGRPLALAAGSLGVLATWMLVSGIWSDAPGRALVEFDRALLYVLVLVLFGSVARTSGRLRLLAGGLALAAVVVATAALATRLYPDEFPISVPSIGPNSLSYPISYANALSLLSVLGGILCLYFASSSQQARAVRVAGAAALPILATTCYLTQARGPLVAAFVGVAAFVVLGRPRALAQALAAAGPAAAIAVASAAAHPLLTSRDPASSAAAAEGHEVALVLALCVIGAAVVRLLLIPLDARLAELTLNEQLRRRLGVAAAAAAVLLVVAVAAVALGSDRASAEYDRFAARGLADNWKVGLDGFADAPLRGHGAGTFELLWYERRPADEAGNNVTDGHSLYFETLGELGAVGFSLLAIFMLAALAALAPVRRGGNRSLFAALFALVLAWAVHSAADWDWEMPVVTAGIMAVAGAALARHREDVRPTAPPQGVRVAVALALLASAIAPALLFVSERRLEQSRDAARAGDCRRAIERASASIDALALRAEPYEVLAICQARAGRIGFALEAIERAVDRDPHYWRYRVAFGVLRGGVGLDPRPELLRARNLNPHDKELQMLVDDTRPGEAVDWDIELAPPRGAFAEAR